MTRTFFLICILDIFENPYEKFLMGKNIFLQKISNNKKYSFVEANRE